MTWRLDGERAIVTGAQGRLGPVWAQALRDAGATVFCTDHPEVLGGFFGKSSAPPQLCGACDITDEREVRQAVELAASVMGGPPTILVNNAGVDDRPSMTQGEVWPQFGVARKMALVNLVGTYIMLQAVGQMMADAGKGSIINIASLYGLVSPDDKLYSHLIKNHMPPKVQQQFHKHPMYGATKAGIVSLTRYFAAFWGPQGVRVNALAPGGVIDPNDSLTGQDPEFVGKYTAKIPMGRMCTPADLGDPLVFLASEASSFVTGQCLVLDGGFLCW